MRLFLFHPLAALQPEGQANDIGSDSGAANSDARCDERYDAHVRHIGWRVRALGIKVLPVSGCGRLAGGNSRASWQGGCSSARLVLLFLAVRKHTRNDSNLGTYAAVLLARALWVRLGGRRGDIDGIHTPKVQVQFFRCGACP